MTILNKVLVTGATGLLGNNLVRQLLSCGCAVRVLTREGSDTQPLAGLDVDKHYGDLRDPAQVASAVEGVSGVIHSAGFVAVGWSQGELAHAINVKGTKNVAQAARSSGAKMVHVSTVNTLGLGSEGQPADEDTPRTEENVLCPYVVSKAAAEEAVQAQVDQGLHATIVHPGFMLGPWDWKPSSGKMLLAVARQYTPVAPRGGCSVCDVRDVADASIQALEQGESGRRYILAGSNLLYFDLWTKMAEITGGKPPKVRPRGQRMSAIAGAVGDLRYRLTGKEPDVNSAATRMSGQYHYYSSDRAIKELGYQVRDVEKSIADAWRWFQEQE